MERYGRHIWLGIIPLALIAAVDLATGALTGDRRIDVALLAAAAMSVYSLVSQRRLARRLRDPDWPPRATPWMWVRGTASIAFSLAFCAGIGYLVGGVVAATLFVSGLVLLFLVIMVLARRKQRT